MDQRCLTTEEDQFAPKKEAYTHEKVGGLIVLRVFDDTCAE